MARYSVRWVAYLLLVVVLGTSCKKEQDVLEDESSEASSLPQPTPTPEPTEPPEEAPFAIRASSSVDENLFLLRLLEHYYDSMPDADAGQAEIRNWLTATKQNMGSVRNIVRTRNLDQEVDALYADGERLMATLESYLTNIGAIEAQRSSQTAPDVLASIWEGYQTGSDAQDIARFFGSSEEDSGNIGTFVGVLSGLAELAEREQQKDAAVAEALATQKQLLVETWTEIAGNAQRTSTTLTRRYGWSSGEAGFDGFESKMLRDHMKRRPRDPFLKIRYANTRMDNETPEDILNDARLCIEAAQLVPASPFYDTIRNDFVLNGVELAAWAAGVESGGLHGRYSARPRLAPQVLSFSRTYLSLDSRDATGRGHMALARGLAYAGRYREAIDAANEAYEKEPERWRKDPVFCYRYAAMLSLAGDQVDLVEGWLKAAYGNGLGVDWVRGSEDLANFRRAYPERYETLTTVDLAYRIEFGLFFDDIIIENRSPFGLTNLRGTMTIRQGQRAWNPGVECERIAAGGSCKIPNAVSIPGDRFDEMSPALDCDQCVVY